MGRTFVRQETQIYNSDAYDDAIASGSGLEPAAGTSNIQADLNGIRSQVNRILNATGVGNWFDDVATVNAKKRALSQLNTDLDELEEQPFLFRSQKLTAIAVPGGQNFVVLSVAGGETPSETASVGAVSTEGAVVAFHTGTFGTHALSAVAGLSAITPKNLALVVDATTGEPIQSSLRDIFALIQSEVATNGHTFNDTTQQVQLSFVRTNAGRTALEAVPSADIAGKSFHYSYSRRIHLDNIPEDAFLTGAFLDTTASTDVTLDRAIDNQGVSPATVSTNIRVQLADGTSWDFEDPSGTGDIASFKADPGADEAEFNVDVFDVNNLTDADFLNGAKFDTGGTTINVGVTAGQVDSAAALTLASAAGGDLKLVASGEVTFDDSNKGGSSFAGTSRLSDTAAEWTAFKDYFGEASFLRAFALAQVRRFVGRVTGAIAADTNVTGAGGGANLDAQLGNYAAVDFVTKVDIYVNGILVRPGANSSANNDVYPGTAPATGDLKFEFALNTNDVITMFIRGA